MQPDAEGAAFDDDVDVLDVPAQRRARLCADEIVTEGLIHEFECASVLEGGRRDVHSANGVVRDVSSSCVEVIAVERPVGPPVRLPPATVVRV